MSQDAQQKQLMGHTLFVLCFLYTPLVLNSWYLFFHDVIDIVRTIVISISWLAGLATWRLIHNPTWANVTKSLFMVNLCFLVLYAFVKNDYFSNITFAWMFVIPLYFAASIGARYAMVAMTIFFIALFTVLVSQKLGYIPSEEDFATTYRVNKYVQLPLMFIMAIYSLHRFNLLHQQNEQALRLALDNEIKANKAKDVFLSNISHELRTPLSGIYGVLQILKGKDEKEAKFISAARKSSRAINTIINEILDIQKMASGKLEIVPEWQNSDDLFDQLYTMHHTTADLKGLMLTIDYQGLPSFLWCDGTRLTQVFNNIVGNAIKFTQQGGVDIKVSYVNNQLLVTISDTGIGMDTKDLSHLFERFTQADLSNTKRFGGTGLGMAISKEITELMGGSIAVTSTPGVGTTFYLKFPMQGKNTSSTPQSTTAPLMVDHSLRVLLVDDNPLNLMFGREMLQEYLNYVDTATNGEEALALLLKRQYDIVITDIQMPKISGEELKRQLASSHPDLPVIALTANAMPKDVERYLAAGFVGVLTKPFTQRELFNLINSSC